MSHYSFHNKIPPFLSFLFLINSIWWGGQRAGMKWQEMSGIEMHDMKDKRIIFLKVKKNSHWNCQSWSFSPPLINKEVEEGMQTCETGSGLFPLSSLCLTQHAQSWLSGSVMEAPRAKTTPMAIILVIIFSSVLIPEFMTLQISKTNGMADAIYLLGMC